MIQAEFDILTRDDLEKLKFVLDTNWEVAIRLLSTATAIAWGNLTGTLSNQTDLQAELDAKEDSIWYTPENLANKNVINWYAWLWADWKINGSQLPVLAISETFVVASELEQLALTVQEWDVAVRTDENKSYIALNDTNALMSDWQLLLTPTDAVLSVAGKTWVVVLTSTDVWLWNVDNTTDLLKPVSTATQTELNLKANLDWVNTFTWTQTIDSAWQAILILDWWEVSDHSIIIKDDWVQTWRIRSDSYNNPNSETFNIENASWTQIMTLLQSGNVWIWTTSPWAKLDVNSWNINIVARFISTDASAQILLLDDTTTTWTKEIILNRIWDRLKINPYGWNISMPTLPTSATWLSSGDIWINSGVLNIVA